MTLSSPTRTKCAVKGCPGFVDFTTNGSGKHVERCDCCEKRKEFERLNTPKLPPRRCTICGGAVPIPERQPGKRQRWKRHCDACADVASRVAKAKAKAAAAKLSAPNGSRVLARSGR